MRYVISFIFKSYKFENYENSWIFNILELCKKQELSKTEEKNWITREEFMRKFQEHKLIAENLWAIAHLGAFVTNPNLF